jgi:GWxTD domain-containing protein
VWHRYGVLLWQQVADRRRGGFIRDNATISTLRLADSALRLATQFAPDSAEYWITLAQFNLQSDVSTMRFSASKQMSAAQSAAERAGDSIWIALAADEVGLAAWRRREATANRAMTGPGLRLDMQTNGRFQRTKAKDHLETFVKKIQPPTGAGEYETAVKQFRVASTTSPVQLTYSRHLFMALAAGNQWDELLSEATQRAHASPFDHQARFGRGLALHRLGRFRDARAAFDTAMMLIEPSEHARLFSIARLLPADTNGVRSTQIMSAHALRALTDAQKAASSALYWALNDPRTSTDENEAELEFIARVIQAEWTWTDDTMGLRGVDTDRGDIFVRYGPPDSEMTLAGKSSVVQDLSRTGEVADDYWTNPSRVLNDGKAVSSQLGAGGMDATSQLGGATLVWIYASGDVFFFDLAPGFGTANIPLTDQQFVQTVKSAKPVAWDNVGAPTHIDSIALRVTRFRANGDSADVVLTAQLPVKLLGAANTGSNNKQKTADAISGPNSIRLDLRLVDAFARRFGDDSARIAPESTADVSPSWVRKMGLGATIVRLDAEQIGFNRVAKAFRPVIIEHMNGFGVSDILLATVGITPPSTAPSRWRELGLTPSAGVFRTSEKIGVAWETYGLSTENDNNRYRVSISVVPVQRRSISAMTLRIFDLVGSLIKESKGTDDGVTVSFDRSVSARATQVDYLTLDGLGKTEDVYMLRLMVTDLVNNQSTTRTTLLTVKN